MSPIIDIQRRLREVGRIRLGNKVPTKSGGERPSKLDKFRFTSADEHALSLVAKMYGGEVRPWDGAAVGESWELFTETNSLDVLVPPVDLAWSQYMEFWSGGVLRRRCDRERMVADDSPCICDLDKPDCKPTSRLGVILIGVDGIGIWRLESHGWGSATELNGAIEILRVVQQNTNAMATARLLLEQRQQKRINPDNNKMEVFNFAVPVLDLNLSVAALTGHAVTAASPPPQLTSGVTPITVIAEASSSIAEQALSVNTPPERPKRSNAAAPLPSTGLKPRGMSTAVQDIKDHLDNKETTEPRAPKTPTKPASNKTEGGASPGSLRRLMAIIGGNKSLKFDSDEDRYAWAEIALNHPVTSFNLLTQTEISHLSDIAEGKAALIPDEPEQTYAADDPERPF